MVMAALVAMSSPYQLYLSGIETLIAYCVAVDLSYYQLYLSGIETSQAGCVLTIRFPYQLYLSGIETFP